MNREISFRGKRTKTVEWVYGLLWHNNEKSAAIYSDKHDRLCWVKPETVGQFTGLTDKNGKRIFEGDIVRLPELFGSEIATIEYLGSAFKAKSSSFCYQICESMVVLGNIHDNPELLNGTEY